MAKLALHPATNTQVVRYIAAPAHAVVLVGSSGSGKASLALHAIEQVLAVPDATAHQYVLHIAPQDGKAISIEAIRTIERFMQRKVPTQAVFNRAVIVEDAHTLGEEAQNALLKTLEEPPEGTLILMTASHTHALLPTILSRTQQIAVHAPDREALQLHFQDAAPEAFAKAYSISGGLPGLMHAILEDEDHPLLPATERARALLGQSPYERLLTVDELAKQRQLALDVTFILQQMARISLQSATGATAKRWQGVLGASYDANEALTYHAQPKLTLTKLMLSI